MAAVLIWGLFLLAIGVAMLIFNKRYAAWGTRVMSWNPYARPPFARPLAILVALMFIFVGVGTLLSIRR